MRLSRLHAVLMSSLALGAMHCAAEPVATQVTQPAGEPAAEETDAPEADAPAAAPPPAANQGGGGKVDSGLPPAESVCGGAKGDPAAVPLLVWKHYAFGSKYRVRPGAKAPTGSEPLAYSSNGAIVSGTVVPVVGSFGSATYAAGPLKSTILTREQFRPLPESALSSTIEKVYGYTDATGGVFDLATKYSDTKLPTFRAGGSAWYVQDRSWAIDVPAPNAYTLQSDWYVRSVTAARGGGWIFTIHFDHPCKAEGLDALLGGSQNPVDILAPQAPHTRAEVSKFLVDNGARLSLAFVTVGGDAHAEVEAPLQGSQASAANLDALESTLTAFTTALSAASSTPAAADALDAIVAGTSPSLVVGSVTAQRASELPGVQ